MALVNMKTILSESVQKKYAVGAFPSFDLISAEAAVAACEEKKIPLILLWSHNFLYQVRHDPKVYMKCLLAMIDAVKTPVTIILDHGASFEECMQAISLGVPSVMFDGSSLPFEENVAVTKEIVKIAHACGVSVEAEVGHVGGHEGDGSDGVADSRFYTDPADAKRFAELTGVDALAVAIGTVHGVYRGEPKLDIQRLAEIRSAVGDLPLVMHGGSGLSDEQFKAAVANGVNKINFVTGMMIEASDNIADAKYKKESGTNKKFTFMDAVSVAQGTIKNRIWQQADVFNTQTLIV